MSTHALNEAIVSRATIPHADWGSFLEFFSRRHHRWLVWIETHDTKTDETVVSRNQPLLSAELDLEDEKNPRINITVESGNKEIKHVFFRPSKLALYVIQGGAEEALHFESLNTSTTVHLRVAATPESVDEMP
jgi:hypothetical protein